MHFRGNIAVSLLVALFALCAAPVSAQSLARFSVDSAISVDQFVGRNTVDRPNIMVDVIGVLRLGAADGWST